MRQRSFLCSNNSSGTQGERIQKVQQNGGWWKYSNTGSPFAGGVLTLALGSAAAASFSSDRETQCAADKRAVSAGRQELRALITQADEMFLAKQYAALLVTEIRQSILV